MTTKKKLGHQLRIGDAFMLPADRVQIIGMGNIAHSVVSEEGGKILCYRVKCLSGPFRGEEREVILLGNGKVNYVLKDPPVTRLAQFIIDTIKNLFKRKPKVGWPKKGSGKFI